MSKRFFLLSFFILGLIFFWIFFEKSFSKDLLEQIAEGVMKRSFEKISAINISNVKKFFENSIFKKQAVDQIMQKNPYRYISAVVRKGPKKLDPGFSLEGDFLVQRLEKNRNAITQLTGINIESDIDIPRVGFVFSGGGYRAMTLTAGYMQGFDDLGLVDVAQYMVGLSGSTWWMGPYLFMHAIDKNISIKTFNELIREKIKHNKFDPVSRANALSLNSKRIANDIVFPKIVFGQPMSSVDFYGGLLAHALLSNFGDFQQKKHLSEQWFLIKSGGTPWPIYTAIAEYPLAKYVYSYHWYEFNPEEIRNLEHNLAIPAFAFGRKFNEGRTQDFAPEQSFGFLMGIFGSAYTVNLQDIKRMMMLSKATPNNNAASMQENIQKQEQAQALLLDISEKNESEKDQEIIQLSTNKSTFDSMKEALMNMIISSLADTRIGNQRVAPATVFNPFKNYAQASPWLRNQETTIFVDAGIAYNIPLRPLFEPQRALDLIFVADSSSNAATADELKKAFADIGRTMGITYSKSGPESDKTVHVYRSDNNIKAPIVVYINFLKDDQLLERAMRSNSFLGNRVMQSNLSNFDVESCISDDYCNTFNFNYTLNQFDQLSLLASLNVVMHRELFIRLLEERIGKQTAYEFGG